MGLIFNGGFQYLLTRFHSWKDFTDKSIVMLGKQDVGFTYKFFIEKCSSAGFELKDEDVKGMSNKQLYSRADSEVLFSMLGFKEVHALDVSDYEGADICVDLNVTIPEELHGRFDVVYDGGTLEHIFNVKTGLDNISLLTKKGGVIIHDVPAANWCNHGFYSFSPTLFLDYYMANNFEVNTTYLYVYNFVNGRAQYCTPDCRLVDVQPILAEKMDLKSERAILVCVVTKKEDSAVDRIPMQAMYVDMHKQVDEVANTLEYMQKKGYKKVALYGTGAVVRTLIDRIEQIPCEILGLIDSASDKIGKELRGYQIFAVEDIVSQVDCIVIASFKFADVIEQRLYNMGNTENVEIINMKKIGDAD